MLSTLAGSVGRRRHLRASCGRHALAAKACAWKTQTGGGVQKRPGMRTLQALPRLGNAKHPVQSRYGHDISGHVLYLWPKNSPVRRHPIPCPSAHRSTQAARWAQPGTWSARKKVGFSQASGWHAAQRRQRTQGTGRGFEVRSHAGDTSGLGSWGPLGPELNACLSLASSLGFR